MGCLRAGNWPDVLRSRGVSGLRLLGSRGTLTTSILPLGWRDRLVVVSNELAKNPVTGKLYAGLCLDPANLCMAKLCAGREKDRAFVAAFFGADLVDREAVRQRLGNMPPEHVEIAAVGLAEHPRADSPVLQTAVAAATGGCDRTAPFRADETGAMGKVHAPPLALGFLSCHATGVRVGRRPGRGRPTPFRARRL